MRAVIVKASTLSNPPGLNYSRWDAGYWVGRAFNKANEEKVTKAELRLKQAKVALKNAKAELKEEQGRMAEMVANGTVVPCE